MMSWQVETISRDNFNVSAYYSTFDNGFLIFITDSDIKISSIAVGTPIPKVISPTRTTSTPILFGSKNSLTARTIVEKIAQKTKKIVILILHLSIEDSPKLMSLIGKLIDQVLQKESPK